VERRDKAVSFAEILEVDAPVRRFKPYPEYKDCGVEWLGEIPAHWEAKRLKFVAPVRISKLGAKPDNATYIGLEHVESWTGRLLLDTQPESVDSVVAAFEPGDVLFGKLRPYLAKVARPSFGGVCTSEIVPLRPTVAYSQDYLFYNLLNAPFVRWLDSLTYGARMPRVSPEQLSSTSMPVPPGAEQRGIAAFLDRETARIDALVAKKEALIALLQEKRTALITRAVTKGLDPTAPMKDSGIEWLGEIPAHWEVAPIYARYEVALGKMLDSKRVTGEFSGLYLRNVDVQWDLINTEDLPTMDFAPWERERYLLKPGDLLVCEGGEVGRAAIWKSNMGECFYQKALHRVRPRSEKEAPRFFYYLMYTAAKAGIFTASGNPNTIDHLTGVQLRHYRFPFAPPQEQRTIVASLDLVTADLDGLIAEIRAAIGRLNEFRTALISAAVTGKIDVRGEAA
jgi:type I restriction enzyme, S subunit